MKIILPPGETITVELQDSDGQFQISYGEIIDQHLTVHADMPDPSGRVDVIYDEDFSTFPDGTATDLRIPESKIVDGLREAVAGEVSVRELHAVQPSVDSSPQRRLRDLGMIIRSRGLVQATFEVYGMDHSLLSRDLLKAVDHV